MHLHAKITACNWREPAIQFHAVCLGDDGHGWLHACLLFLTAVFRRVEGICLVISTLFIYSGGKEPCEVSGLITTSFQSWLRAPVTGIQLRSQLFNYVELHHNEMAACFLVGRAWPWVYPCLCLLRALILDSNSLCHLVGAPLPWERSFRDRDRFGAGGKLRELCYNRNTNIGCIFFFTLE